MSPPVLQCRVTLPRPAVVLLNDTGLFDLLFDEAHVMDFVGALEYEPGAPGADDRKQPWCLWP